MFTALKKTVTIILFSLISIFSCGSYLIYKSYLYSYKSDFKAYINTNKKDIKLSTILISPSELYVNSKTIIWEDENKEVIHQGVLYDIVSIKNQNGKVVLFALSDCKEQEFKKQFAENFNESSSKSTGNTLKLLKQFLALKYVSSDASLVFNNTSILNEYKRGSCFKPEPVFISTETLPPNLFV